MQIDPLQERCVNAVILGIMFKSVGKVIRKFFGNGMLCVLLLRAFNNGDAAMTYCAGVLVV